MRFSVPRNSKRSGRAGAQGSGARMPIHAGMPLPAAPGSPDATSSHRGPGPGAATRRRSAGRCRPGSASPGWSGSSASWPPPRRRRAAQRRRPGRPGRCGHPAGWPRRSPARPRPSTTTTVAARGRGSARPRGCDRRHQPRPVGRRGRPPGAPATPAGGSGGFGGSPSAPSGSAAPGAPAPAPPAAAPSGPAPTAPPATSPPTTQPAPPPPPPPPPPDCCSGGS